MKMHSVWCWYFSCYTTYCLAFMQNMVHQLVPSLITRSVLKVHLQGIQCLHVQAHPLHLRAFLFMLYFFTGIVHSTSSLCGSFCKRLERVGAPRCVTFLCMYRRIGTSSHTQYFLQSVIMRRRICLACRIQTMLLAFLGTYAHALLAAGTWHQGHAGKMIGNSELQEQQIVAALRHSDASDVTSWI